MRMDMLIGAYGAQGGNGRGYLVFGSDSLADIDMTGGDIPAGILTYTGEGDTDRFCYNVVGSATLE